jgi:hypothetical protein
MPGDIIADQDARTALAALIARPSTLVDEVDAVVALAMRYATAMRRAREAAAKGGTRG